MMKLEIRDMRPEDMDGKGYVHWKSWQETYPGLVDAGYLSRMTLEKCREIAHRRSENTLVAELDGKITGFICYGRNDSGANEIISIYLLKEAQGLGLGRRLMDEAFRRLAPDLPVVLWVLKGNDQAIGFYKHYGFRLDGTTKDISIGTELRMTCQRV